VAKQIVDDGEFKDPTGALGLVLGPLLLDDNLCGTK
jgi:hypothetical protein